MEATTSFSVFVVLFINNYTLHTSRSLWSVYFSAPSLDFAVDEIPMCSLPDGAEILQLVEGDFCFPSGRERGSC
jgi:hypothetical protein